MAHAAWSICICTVGSAGIAPGASLASGSAVANDVGAMSRWAVVGLGDGQIPRAPRLLERAAPKAATPAHRTPPQTCCRCAGSRGLVDAR